MADAPHELAGHGAEAAVPFPPFDSSLFASQLVWFALTFGALYVILARFVLPKVQAVLDARAATMKTDLEQAAAESAAAEAARVEMERTQAEARAAARKLIDDVRAKAQADLATESAAAEKTLAEQGAAAEVRIEQMRQGALAQISGVADDLARDIVARLAPSARV